MINVKIQAEDKREETDFELRYIGGVKEISKHFKEGETISGKEILKRVKRSLKRYPYVVGVGKIKNVEPGGGWTEIHRDGDPFEHYLMKTLDSKNNYKIESITE